MTILERASELVGTPLSFWGINPKNDATLVAYEFAKEVIRLQQILDEDNVTNLVHQSAKQEAALREAREIIKRERGFHEMRGFSIPELKEWLEKYGEK